MVHVKKTAAIALAAWLITVASASATTVSPSVDQLVNDCAYRAGVTGTYYVTPISYGDVAAYTVPPRGDVSSAQSLTINQCVASAVQGKTRPARRSARVQPTDTATCLAAYKQKLRSTNNGNTYRGDNAGTRLVSGLFGRRMGRQLIEHEYDRCLDAVDYAQDRCPTGVFSGGSAYCVKRPYR